MYRTSTNFDTFNTANAKPVVIIEFDGIATKFSTQTFNDITGNHKKLLRNVEILGPRVDLLSFNTTFYGYNFEIIDKSDVVTGLFSGNAFTGRKITVKVGFQELDDADFLTLPVAWISDYQLQPDLLTYRFKARDFNFLLKRPIFTNIAETELVGNIAISSSELMPNSNDRNFIGGSTSWADFDLVVRGGVFNDVIDLSLVAGGAGVGSFCTCAVDGAPTTIGGAYKMTVNVGGLALTWIIKSFDGVQTIGTITGPGTQSFYWTATTIGGYRIVAGAPNATGNFDNFTLNSGVPIVTATTGFTAAGTAPWGDSTNTYLKIEQEIMRYTAISASPPRFTVTRGQLNTRAQAHSAGAKVSEVFRVLDNPFEFLLQILQTSAGGAGGTFDLSLTGWGLSMGSNIDETQIKNEYQRWQFPTSETTDQQSWVIDRTINNAATFIKENILKLIPMYYTITEDGKLGVKLWDLKLTTEGDDTFNLDNSRNPQVTILSKDVITQLEVYRQWEPGVGDWEDIDEITVANVAVYGNQRRILIKPNIETGIATSFFSLLNFRYFLKNANPPVLLRLSTFLQKQLMQVGDVVNYTSSKMPRFISGSRGWTAEGCEVIGQNINIGSGGVRVDYDLINNEITENFTTFTGEIHLRAAIDDPTLALSAVDTDALEAADAFRDTDGGDQDNITLAEITIQATLPGGADQEENITLALRLMDLGGVATQKETKLLYYNASKTGTGQWSFYIISTLPFFTLERVKVDWIAESGGGGDKLTDVEFTKIKLLKVDFTVTNTDIK